MTPELPVDDPIICRQFSVPESLLPMLDSAVGQLCHGGNWTRGDDVSAAPVDDVIEAFNKVIETAYERGCRMVGQVIELGTNSVPAWALLCDGTTYLGADYPELWAVISDGLKTDGTHFRTPDRINRFGMGGPPTGTQGGENSHVLTVTEMPAHAHTDLGHTHTDLEPFGEFLALGPGEEPVVLAAAPGITGSGNANIQNTGGDAGHNNLPQYEGTIYVIVATSHD